MVWSKPSPSFMMGAHSWVVGAHSWALACFLWAGDVNCGWGASFVGRRHCLWAGALFVDGGHHLWAGGIVCMWGGLFVGSVIIRGWGLTTGQAVVCGWLLSCGWAPVCGLWVGALIFVGGGSSLMGFGQCLSFVNARVGGVIIEAGGAAHVWAVQVIGGHPQCSWVRG